MSPQAKKQSINTKLILGGVVAAIVAALVIANLVGDSKDTTSNDATLTDSSGTITSDATSTAQVVSMGENQNVEVVGELLEPLADSGTDPTVGLMAPTLNGYAFDGSNLSVTSGDGQPYMVVFLAHWCPHCNDEIPRLIEWNESGAVPTELQVIGVSTAVASDRPNYPPSQWIVDKGWPWPIMADSTEMKAAEAYGVSGFPFFVIVGEDGTVKARASGELGVDAIQQIVDNALTS